jgi:LAO/AO transport system kinase
MGDDIQAIKAGILEIADIFVVNKSDRPGADQTAAELRMLLSLDERRAERQWRPPILKAIAATGEGVPELVDALARHAEHLRDSGQLAERDSRQASSEVIALLQQQLIERLFALVPTPEWERLLASVTARETDPYTVATQLAKRLGISPG